MVLLSIRTIVTPVLLQLFDRRILSLRWIVDQWIVLVPYLLFELLVELDVLISVGKQRFNLVIHCGLMAQFFIY